MKKLFLLLLGVLMAFPALALTFTYTYAGQELKYTTNGMPEGEVAVSAYTRPSGDLIIPESVESFSVTKIAEDAFYWCGGITSVTIPSSVTIIGDHAFHVCSGLTSVTIPASVTSIGDFAFSDCYGMTTVTIPASVTSIGDEAFSWCNALTSVTIPASVTSIGKKAFSNCTGLTSVTIPASVTSISEGIFYMCTGLTSVTIPASVTSIGVSAFSWCTQLASVTIPASVISIGNDAFNMCYGLTSVYYDTVEPISGDYSIFKDSYSKAILYVPEVAVEKCKMIDPWKNFANIQAYNFSSGIGDAVVDFDAGAPYEVYSLKGVKAGDSLDGLAPGVYILRQGRAVKKVTMK